MEERGRLFTWLLIAVTWFVATLDTADGQCTTVVDTVRIALVVTDTTFSVRVRDTYNLNNGGGVRSIPSQDPTRCVELRTKTVTLPDRYRGLRDVFDEQAATALNDSDIIVGDFDSSLYHFAAKNEIYYATLSPLSLDVERLKDRPQTFVSMWPAQSLFVKQTAALVNHMLMMNENKRVLVLYYTETIAGIEYVDALAKRITSSTSAQLTTYDLAREAKQFRGKTILEIREKNGFVAYFLNLRKLLTRIKFRYVVLYLDMDSREKIKLIDWFFQEESELEDKGTDWLIADMTFPFEQYAMAELRRYVITHPRIFYLTWDPSYKLEQRCAIHEEYGEIENVAMMRLFEVLRAQAALHEFGPDSINFLIPAFNGGWKLSPLELQMKPKSWDVMNFPSLPVFAMYERTPERDEPVCGNLRVLLTGLNTMFGLMNNQLLTGLVWSGDYETDYGLGGIPIVIEKTYAVIIKEMPFVFETRQGQKEYEGLAMDVFYAVKRMLILEGLDLKLELKEVDVYGSRLNGTWNGLFGEMQNDNHTVLGIGQISVNEERSQDFDFTIPIGYSFETYLVQKELLYHQYFQFLRPFTGDVWLLMSAIMIVSGVYLFGMDQWNPFKDEFPEGGRFNGEEGMWHSFLVITQAGAPFGAHSYPNRVYSVFYWFFALVVVGCYTGNLANFLIESATTDPVIDIPSLGYSDRYKFGMLANTSVTDSFENDPKLAPLWEKVNQRNDFVANYSEGLERVRGGRYVLFGTSLVLTYHHNQDEDCMLTMYQPTYYNRRKQAAIAFPMRRDWIYKDRFNRAMQQMRESGELQLIYNRWIAFSANCHTEEDDDSHLKLSWDNFVGLYILLAIGTIFSFLMLLIKLRHLSLEDKRKNDNAKATRTSIEMADKPDEEEALTHV